MLRWAAIFLVIALIAALFGFTDIASASASIAQVLFAIFLVLFVGTVLFGAFLARRGVGGPIPDRTTLPVGYRSRRSLWLSTPAR